MLVVLSVLTVVTTGFIFFANPRASENTTLVEPIPPPEFVPGTHQRRPSGAVDLIASMSSRPYEFLDEEERRTLFRAVIHSCNESGDVESCNAYLFYCGQRCRMLVKGR